MLRNRPASLLRKMRKPARSKGAVAAHLLRACFCIFRKKFKLCI